MLRLLGVRMGRRVFDDGCSFVEKTLVTIGDDCTLNAGSIIQSHSQEDGAFKSDYITIGSGCTVGVGAWVHYGVSMADGAVLAADSFLMKGEQVPQDAYWGGNPAEERHGSAADLRNPHSSTPRRVRRQKSHGHGISIPQCLLPSRRSRGHGISMAPYRLITPSPRTAIRPAASDNTHSDSGG